MAQSQQPERSGEAEFVRQIVTDPRNVPDVMRLYGYPGASSEEHHDRLYLNPDLSQYVEVPRNAILHRMAVPAEQDPNGAVVLWVRRDAALVYKSAPAAQALANYFAGAIAGAAAAAPGWPAAPFPPYTGIVCWTPQCPPITRNFLECSVVCPSGPVACHSWLYQPCGAAAAAAGGAAMPGAAMPLLYTPHPGCPTPGCTPACPTHQQTPCLPCPTHQQTPCPPCPTHGPGFCPTVPPAATPCAPCGAIAAAPAAPQAAAFGVHYTLVCWSPPAICTPACIVSGQLCQGGGPGGSPYCLT